MAVIIHLDRNIERGPMSLSAFARMRFEAEHEGIVAKLKKDHAENPLPSKVEQS